MGFSGKEMRVGFVAKEMNGLPFADIEGEVCR